MPTAAEREGDFSRSVLPPPINPFTGQPFPGDQIPSFVQNPIGQAIAALYPLPNRDAPFGQLRVVAQPATTATISSTCASIGASAAGST